MFRIIAIRLFSPCKDYIVRALHRDTTYFFYNDYEDIGGEYWCGIQKRKKSERHFESYYNGFGKNNPEISISSIVGKNGEGKSSLIEAMIRIINNFTVKAGFLNDHKTLSMANGVYGVLFYEVDGDLHSIECQGEEVKLDEQLVKEDKLLLESRQNLFYTIVNNYSIYSYNSKLFEKESEDGSCWINGVFHKNDGYQTPIVLTPMRTEGKLDINTELQLCRQRLMSLYADSNSFSNNRIISDEKFAKGYAFNLVEESKLIKSSLTDYFRTIWGSRSLRTYYRNYEEYLEKKHDHYRISEKYYTEEDFRGQLKFFSVYNAHIIDKYRNLFQMASDIHHRIWVKMTDTEEDPEVRRYLKAFTPVAKDFIADKPVRSNLISALEALSLYCGYINGLELQRICYIIDICERWEQSGVFEKDYTYSVVFDETTQLPEEKKQALMYLAYKTLAIFSHYKPYTNLIDTQARAFMFFEYPMEGNQDIYNGLEKCFDELFIETKQSNEIKDSFDTIKLKQTINFLRHEEYALWKMDAVPSSLSSYGFTHYISFDYLSLLVNELISKIGDNSLALLPPPIYEGEIIVEDKTTPKGLFPMSELSSGELQMLNSIGTFTYHLRNLEQLHNRSTPMQYKYVNLVLEEVELYFHPDYQRQYIYRLLEQISQVHFSHIRSINVIIVTHSPFVLSDIPQKNILYLEKGSPKTVAITPFAANIGDTLKDSFFLGSGFMGEYTRCMIASLLLYLVPKDRDYYGGWPNRETIYHMSLKWDDEKAESFIREIGDRLVRESLYGLLEERKHKTQD